MRQPPGHTKKHQIGYLAALPGLIALLFLADVSLGSVRVPLGQTLVILLGGEPAEAAWGHIVWQFRLPRAITAMLAGAGLSVSGLMMQTFFRNPLAGPFVLGISTGASLGVALLVLAGALLPTLALADSQNPWATAAAATMGSALVMATVLAFSARVKDPMGLLVIGLMFGSAAGAMISVLQFFSQAAQIQAYLVWTLGSLGGLSWLAVGILAAAVATGLCAAFALAKTLNTLLLGEHYAQTMGLGIRATRMWVVASTSLLAGVVTAFCGPIAFVGLAMPHLARLFFASANHQLLLPAVAGTGVVAMLVCDIVSQWPGSQYVLPINAITALVGAPVVVWVILRKRHNKSVVKQ